MKKTNLVIVLTAGYLLCQIIADVTASKMVDLFGIYVPAAVFIYALTFTIRDVAHKQLGKKATVHLIITAGIVNVLMALYFMFTVALKPAGFWGNQEAYAMIIGVVPRVVTASILAEVASELIDTEIYQRWIERFPNAPQWSRVLVSNGISLPIDSVIFVGIAFFGTMPINALISVMVGQIIVKAVITIISIPMIYLVPTKKVYVEDGLAD
jgi:uncharacterized integral membrane protein (TIGR00697 family)